MAEFEYPHIGKLIENELANQHMTKKELGSDIGLSQSNIVYLTKRKSIDVITLHKIGEALSENFFKYYPVKGVFETKPADENDRVIAELKTKIAEMEKQAEQKRIEMEMMKQENGYLKKINELLEKNR
jgi:DNA-binding Xre family transcriptional regulator